MPYSDLNISVLFLYATENIFNLYSRTCSETTHFHHNMRGFCCDTFAFIEGIKVFFVVVFFLTNARRQER